MPILLLFTLAALLFIAHAAAIVLVIGPLMILQPVRKKTDWYARFTPLLEPRDAGLPQETFSLKTPDGISLHCWFVPRRSGAKGTVIYLHGVGDCKIGGIPLAQYLYSSGYNVFLYDQRQHGESGGTFCTYGYYEKNDVSTVIDYLESRRDLSIGPIAVFGTSMGAAIAIQAAAIEPRIRVVIAEASFTNLREIIVDYQRRIIKLPWHFLRNAALARTQQLAQFKGRDVSPVNDVRRLTTPILFIHGTNDTLIRHEYSLQLYAEANEPKKLLLIEGADHNDVWDTGGKKYRDTLTEFLEDHLPPHRPNI